MRGAVRVAVVGAAIVACGRIGFEPQPTRDGPDLIGSGGVLDVTAASLADGDIDLTAEGTLDWGHWGYAGSSSWERKALGGVISDASLLGSGAKHAVTGVGVTSTWSDGTPTASVLHTATSIAVSSPDTLQLSAGATNAMHLLRLYVGGKNARARVLMHLTDSSAPDYVDDQFGSGSSWHATYTAVYRTAIPAQLLAIEVSDEADAVGGACTGGDCFVELLSVTAQ